MKRRRPVQAAAALLLLPVLGLALAGGCRARPPFRYDFEQAASLDELGWTCRTLYRLSPLHATSGAASLEMVLYPAPAGVEDTYPGLSLMWFEPDWTGFRALVFDAHNPGDATLDLRVRIDDRRDAAGGDWFWRATPLGPGDNRVAIPLAELRTRAGRRMKLRKILGVTLYVANPAEKRTVYLDNLRLE